MENFIFKKEWREALKGYPAEVRAEVYEAIMAYAFEGEILPMSDLAKMAFNFIKLAIDAMQESYAKKCNRNRESANRRWNKGEMSTDANGCERIQTDANDANGCEAMQSIQINSNQFNSNQESVCNNAHPLAQKFQEFQNYCQQVAPLAVNFKEPLTIEDFAWLYNTFGATRIKKCAEEMHNKSASVGNRRAITTWRKFMERVV